MLRSAKLRVCLLLVLAGWAGGAWARELGIELGVEHFRWREYEAGERLLEETGPRLRIGAALRAPLAPALDTLELRGGLYFGAIAYDGQACTAGTNCIPFQTDADYGGTFVEALLAHRLAPASLFELFAGAGIDAWQRDIHGRGTVLGVQEEWTVFYLLAGAGVHWSGDGVRYRARAGLNYPFYTYELARLFDVTLHPEGAFSYFARVTAEFPARGRLRWGAGVYYDSYRFDESDPENVDEMLLVFQPDSRQDTIGLYAVYYLR